MGNTLVINGANATGMEISGPYMYLPKELSFNKVLLPDGGTGINFGPAMGETNTFNNMIAVKGDAGSKGITFWEGDHFFYYNAIYIFGQEDISSNILGVEDAKLRLTNNILANLSGGSIFSAYYDDITTWVIASDYNNLYTTGEIFAEMDYNDIKLMDLNEWKNRTGFDIHSLSVDPQFESTENLIPTNSILDNAGTAIPEVQQDFFGNSRQDPPAIGAVELDIPQATLYSINAGSTAYQKIEDILWSADNHFTGGKVYKTTKNIEGTSIPSLYKSERYGDFNYEFPVENGHYNIKLHFAEIYFSNPGKRVFNVAIEGEIMLENYDIVADAGAFTAVIKTLNNIEVKDGFLSIAFISDVNNAKISAIQFEKVVLPDQLYINAGSTTSNKLNGVEWHSDKYFSGGKTYQTTRNISNTTTPLLYQTERYGSFTYELPVKNGNYDIELHFAEIYLSGPGKRVFDVSIEGNTVLPGYDIVADAGAFSAVVKKFRNIYIDDGFITIEFSSVVNNAKVSAIAIEKSVLPDLYQVNSGCMSSQTIDGVNWKADSYFSGGQRYTTNKSISNTTNPKLYQTERYGNFSYDIPVANGDYDVDLHFAEIYWSEPGKRSFNVFIEGKKVLYDYDIVADVGAFTAVVKRFRNITVNDGSLNISFISVIDNAKVSSIRIEKPVLPNRYRVNSGNTNNHIFLGEEWSADRYFTGGKTYQTTEKITLTSRQELYQTERYGNFSYEIPVTNGHYDIKLHFAEIYWNEPGKRKFDVAIEGINVLSGYDIVNDVGSFWAVVKTFNNIGVSDGSLSIRFKSIIDNAKISGIEINKSISSARIKEDMISKEISERDKYHIHVYPNPTNGLVTLQVNNPDHLKGRYVIYNSLGSSVFSGTLENKTLINTDISLSGRGLYILKLEIGDQIIQRKIIVE